MAGSEPLRREDRCIHTPALVMSQEKLLVGAMLLWLIVFPLVPRGGLLLLVPILGIMTLLALWRHHRAASHLGIFSSLCLVAILIGAPSSQLFLGLGIIGYGLIVWAIPWLRGPIDWLRLGRVDRTVVTLSLAFIVLSGVALVLWHQLLRPDLQDIFETFIPDLPVSMLLLGGIVFSMINAAVEEIAYRGVIFSALRATFAPSAVAHFGQALAFGTLHFQAGFPRGTIGVLLAVVYGLMMSVLRARSRGMLAPWAVHVLIDITIVAILLFLAR